MTVTQQGSLLAFAGMFLGVLGAYCMGRQVTRRSWAAVAVDAVDGLPDNMDLAIARSEFMRLQGKSEESLLPKGEILRPVNFPGKDQPVNLLDMYEEFERLLGSDEGGRAAPKIGTRLKGKIFDIDEKGVSVDYGGKLIGFCPAEELALFKVRKAETVVSVGQERTFEVLAPPIRRRRGEDEVTLLSLKAISEEVAWKRLQQYRENNISFPVVIKGKNRGGYMIEMDDFSIPGFLPRSQTSGDLATAPENAEPETFMEQVVMAKVLDLDAERKRLVVSQRMALRVNTEALKVGTVHEGVVQSVKPYGVFVDINGMSGLLHISQISHTQIQRVEDIFRVGDVIKCMVMNQDAAQGRLSLSTKRLEPIHGDMVTNPKLVYEKAEEMAMRFREDIVQAEARMQVFETKLAAQAPDDELGVAVGPPEEAPPAADAE